MHHGHHYHNDTEKDKPIMKIDMTQYYTCCKKDYTYSEAEKSISLLGNVQHETIHMCVESTYP
jgi:hypothetical protein